MTKKKAKTTTQKKKQALDKELLELWKMACYKAWGDECIICGNTDQTTYHHYIPKSRSIRLKYDVINGVPICNGKAHYKLHHSGTPDEVFEICETIRIKRGKTWCDYIDKAKAMDNRSIYTLRWLEEQKEILNNYLDS